MQVKQFLHFENREDALTWFDTSQYTTDKAKFEDPKANKNYLIIPVNDTITDITDVVNSLLCDTLQSILYQNRYQDPEEVEIKIATGTLLLVITSDQL